MLQRLNDMQSQITSLKASSFSASSLPTPREACNSHVEESGKEVLSDYSSVHESTSSTSRKRNRSPSPHKEIEDNPSCRETLAAIRALLEVEVPDEFSDQPTKIFVSKNKDLKKKPTLPLVMPPSDGIVQRWDFHEAKAAGNPQKGGPERLHCRPVNAYNFLQYNRPLMKFYKPSMVEFSLTAPKCQDAFKSLYPKAIPSTVHVPIRQHTSMETVSQENIQILSYVNWFMVYEGYR